MSFRDHMNEDLRLVVLRLLSEVDGYEANSATLQAAVTEFGHRPSRDQVHTQLAWLQEQGLLKVTAVATVQIAALTARGLDVAQGRAVVPGVKRPSPGG
jgi:hypothetical protein